VLRGADLRYAKLNSAVLNGAELNDAKLNGANLTRASLFGTGIVRVQTKHEATIYAADGMLAYGCESHKISDWPAMIEDLARKHEPDDVDHYIAETRMIVALAERWVEQWEKEHPE
jgi:hypothetical protein